MLSSKERKYLSGLGQTLQPIFQIGKNGLSDIAVKEIGEALEKRELIKVAVLNNCDYTAKELVDELAAKLLAESVSVVGSKIVLYRKSARTDIKHIEFNCKA